MTLTADALVAAMESYVGVAENPPGSNLTTVGEKYGWNGAPWCAMTVSCACADIGFPLHEAAVVNIAAKAQQGWGGMTWTDTPTRGAIICWDFGGRNNPSDMHTGVCTGTSSDGQTMYTIEGNYADRCAKWSRPSHQSIMGFAVLPFDQQPQFTEDEMEIEARLAAIEAAMQETRGNVEKMTLVLLQGLDSPPHTPPGNDAVTGSLRSIRADVAAIRTKVGA